MVSERSGCQTIGVVYGGCFTLFGVVLMFGVTIFMLWLNGQFDLYGVPVKATIDDCFIQTGKNNSRSVRLIYFYTVDGKRYYAQASDDDDDCSRYPEAGTLDILYLSNNPQSTKLADENLCISAVFTSVMTVILMVISFTLFRQLFQRRKAKV